MKITKYIHSCLLVEDQGKTVLIDPGIYSTQEKAISLDTFSALDYLLITHEHADHFDLSFIKQLVTKFPNLQILSNASVRDLLQNENIKTVESIEGIEMSDASHEKVFGITPPQNSVFHVFNKLTHPGDSFQFTATNEILALPVQAPWGSLTQAVALAEKLKPKIIIPIHDWHWNDEAQNAFYERLTGYFKPLGIEFRGLQTNESISI